jgi:vacuolar-type H+-ATPase subunit C/Vma6
MSKSRNMKSGSGYMLRREDYKRVKRMDRQQFEDFCKNLYQTAYEEGRRSVPGIDITEVQKAISETPGIGSKRLQSIMDSLNSKFGEEKSDEGN